MPCSGAGEEAQRTSTGEEEVRAAADRDERRNLPHATAHGSGLDGEATSPRVRCVRRALGLRRRAARRSSGSCTQVWEMNSNCRAMSAHRARKCRPRRADASGPLGERLPRVDRRPVRPAPAQQPVPLAHVDRRWRARFRGQRVSGVGTPHMRAERASEAVRSAASNPKSLSSASSGRSASGSGSTAPRSANGPSGARRRPCAQRGLRGRRARGWPTPRTARTRRRPGEGAHHQVAAVAAEVVGVRPPPGRRARRSRRSPARAPATPAPGRRRRPRAGSGSTARVR